MSPAGTDAWATLRRMARGHPGASSGERATFDLVRNFKTGEPVDLADCFVRLDGEGKRAVILLLIDLATGDLGLTEVR
jgi:hypothetical protein